MAAVGPAANKAWTPSFPSKNSMLGHSRVGSVPSFRRAGIGRCRKEARGSAPAESLCLFQAGPARLSVAPSAILLGLISFSGRNKSATIAPFGLLFIVSLAISDPIVLRSVRYVTAERCWCNLILVLNNAQPDGTAHLDPGLCYAGFVLGPRSKWCSYWWKFPSLSGCNTPSKSQYSISSLDADLPGAPQSHLDD